jgi:hypothetical protein
MRINVILLLHGGKMNSTPENRKGRRNPLSGASDAFSALFELNRVLLDLQERCRPVGFDFARIAPLYEQMARTADVFRQTYASRFLEEHRRVPEMMAASLRSANEAFSRITAGFADIADLNKNIQELSRPWAEDIFQINKELHRPLSAGDILARQISRAMRVSVAAEAALCRFHGRSIGDLVGVTGALSGQLSSHVMSVSSAYSDLVNWIQTEQVRLLDLPPVTVVHPPVEVFNIVELAQSVTEVEPESEVEQVENDLRQSMAHTVASSLHAAIACVDPKLCNLWEGARQTLTSGNPDRERHFVVSLRELFRCILHALSPDDRVREWHCAPALYDKNRPTRRGRLLYICRGINRDEFTTFVNKDVEALLAFIDLFDQGTHAVAPPFNEEQLQAMLHRTEAALIFLINISRNAS